MHIPKCAGQWLDSVLYRILEQARGSGRFKTGSNAGVLMLEDPRFKANIEAFDREIESRRGVRVVSSQKFMHQFPPELGGRPVKYVCMLRDPGDQLLSFLRYSIEGYGTFKSGFQTKLPEGLGEMSLADAAAKLIRQRPGLVTHFLSIRHFSATQDQSEAVANLSKINFLGTVGRSEALVSRLCQWFDPALDVESVLPPERINGTTENEDAEFEARDLPEFREYLDWDAVRISRVLWQHAKEMECAHEPKVCH